MPGSPGTAVELKAEGRRFNTRYMADPAVSVLVSFARVRDRSPPRRRRTGWACNPTLNPAGQRRAELESVLGATPHEFESRILRHSPRGKNPQVRALFRPFGRNDKAGAAPTFGSRPGVVPSQFPSRPTAGHLGRLCSSGAACGWLPGQRPGTQGRSDCLAARSRSTSVP
jgi:hypothetical protein